MKSLKRMLIAALLICSFSVIAQNQNSLHFDGVDDGVSLPASINQTSTVPGTLEAWIKTSNAGAGMRAIIVRPGLHGLFLNNNQLSFYLWNTTTTVTVGPALNDNLWHHVAVTFQHFVTNGSQLYIDGVAVGSPFTSNFSSIFFSYNNGIGYSSNVTTQAFQGEIDKVKLFTRKLSAAEITDEYYCLNVSSTGLLASYNFNQGNAGGDNTSETILLSEAGTANGTLLNMALNGATSNWIDGYLCPPCPAPTGSSYQYVCGGGTIEDLTANGSNLQWYSTASGGAALSAGTVLENTSIYYATQTSNGCESSGRLAVTADLCENSLYFDGADDGVLISSSLNAVSGQSGTAEAWIKTTYAGANIRAIVLKSRVFGLHLTNNYLTFFNSFNGTPVTVGPALNDNKWHHVAVTYQNGVTNGTQLYLDGQPIGSPFTSNPGNLGYDNQIGYCAGLGNSTFTGQIDNVKIYNRVLTPAELLESYYCNPVDQTGLIASYNFNQGIAGSVNTSVTTLLSQTGSHNGTLVNMALSGATSNWVSGRICSACPPPVGPWSQEFCGSATIANLNVIGSNIQWYSTVSGGTPLSSSASLTNATNYYASQTVEGCESADRLLVRVTIGSTIPAAPTGNGTQYFCSGGTLSSIAVTGTGIKWYDVASSVSVLPNSTVLSDAIFYASQTISGCESTDRLAVSVIVTCQSALNFDGSNDRVDLPATTHSGITTEGTLEAWIKTSANNTGYRGLVVRSNYYGLFLVDNKLSTYVWGGGAPVGVTTYNGALLNDNQWHHVALSFQIGVTNGTQMYLDGVAVGPAITLTTLATNNNFQLGSNTTVQFFNGIIDEVKIWSRSLTAQEINNTFNCIENGTSGLKGYYKCNEGPHEQVNTGLTSLLDNSGLNNNGTLVNFALSGVTSNRVSGFVCTPNLCPTPFGSAIQTFCPGSTVADLTANGTNIQWYATSTGGLPLTGTTALVTGSTYYATQTTSCESANRLAVTVTINSVATPTGSASQSFCNSATVANLTATGTGIQWYAASTGGTALSTGTALTNGTTYYASQTISGCQSVNRFAVTVTINAPAAPTGNATQEICTGGNTITVNSLSATGSNIKWYANPSGGTFLASNTPVTNGSTYYASQTINGCESINRLAVTVILHNFTTNVTAPNPQSFCTGATIVDLVANITPGAQLNWYTSSMGWSFGTPLPTNTVLTNGTIYYAGQSLGSTNQCVYAGSFGVTVSLSSTSTPTGSAAQTFCNSATVANLAASGTAIQWYTTSTGGTSLTSGTSLTNGTTYYASQTVSGCKSANRLPVVVTINTPSVPSGIATQTFCSGANIGSLSATGANIQWYAAASGGSPLSPSTLLSNGTIYYASQTVNGCESTGRFAVTAVFGIPSAPTGSAAQTVCNSGTVADLTVVGSNIQWYAASTGGTALSAVTVLTNGSTYYASQTSGGCESTNRLTVTVTINVPATPTGTAAQTFCNSATVANLTATGTGLQWYAASTGGTALTSGTALTTGTTYYASQSISGCESTGRFAVTVTINTPAAPSGTSAQSFCGSITLAGLSVTGSTITWYNASSGGSVLSSSTNAVNGVTYYASQTINGCECTNRLAVQVLINTIPTAPTGSAAQTFCNSATVANLVASGSNLQWYTASTGGTVLSSGTAITNGSTYYASQTSGGCESTTRLAVTVTINTPAAPTGTASQTFCNSGTVANLSATGSGIQWYAASTGGTALSTGTSLVNGTTYYASQTVSGCESNNRFAVTATINTQAAPTGAAAQTFCNLGTVANLTATGTAIQWYAASTGGTALSAGTTLVTGTTYYASQTVSSCESATRFAVTATINVPSAPTAAASQTVCSGAIVGDLSATGSNIQWYAAPSGGSTLASSTALTNGTTYYASQTVTGCESVTRFAVNVVFGIPSAPTGSAAQTFCNSVTVANLVASGSNLQWYTASTGGTVLSSGTAITNGSTYYASQTSGGCESTTRLAVTVTINTPAAPTGTASQTFCNSGTVANLSATGSGIQWYAASTGGTALTSGAALSNGTYYASQTLSGCESATRLAVAVTINAPAAPTGAASQTICVAGTLADLTISGNGITWYDAAVSGNVLTPTTALVNGATYYATQTISGCESLNQLAVTASINAIPSAPVGTASQEFCNSATIADLAVTGTTLMWYASAGSSSPLTPATALSDGASYFATQTVNGCKSTDRLEVAVTINAPATPTGNTTQSFCSAAVVDDLSATGTSIAWYSNATGGTPLAGTAALSNGTYYASQTINNCESLNRLSVAVTVTILNANVTQTGITLTATQPGANYTWVDCNNGNQPIAGANGQSFTPTANGSYAVEIELNGCSVISSCVQISSVGLEEDKLDLLTIQPNPTSGLLMITVSQPTNAVVSAANGTVITTLKLEGETVLDATQFATGIYYLRTSEGQTVKFIKQ